MIEKDLKEKLILGLLGISGGESTKKVGSTLDQKFVGEKVMVRTYSAGVHFGELEEKAGQQAILKNSRRIFSWVEACSLSQLSQDGSGDVDGCKIAISIPRILLDRVIEIIPMSEKAYSQLYGAKEWKR